MIFAGSSDRLAMENLLSPQNVFEIKVEINGKTIKNEDPDDSQLLEYIKNNYYILLSRGMDGCRVYFTNKKLEAYFKSKMKA